MREPEEVERFRLASRHEPGVVPRQTAQRRSAASCPVKLEREPQEPVLQIGNELFSVVLVLEADNGVVRVRADDHVARGPPRPPRLDPKVIDVVEVDVRTGAEKLLPERKR